ncbi:hypothetical protein JOD82_001711 [Paenibacillus sp. 1182]|uniref:hypothetical protein n=1 Tax=Paenibacillus sp. 1182 TaxID=2806565 RepID=UPI001AE9A0FD|nr:hypothetical protein [Paenibacillus sp. 1182]MBP1308691.1 hypothetical protein [Paenibacillus sp. 1182]
MKVDVNFLSLVVIAIIAVVVISFLVRSFMKFIIIGVVIYFLFMMGFVWGVDDLNHKLHLNQIFNASANEKVQSAYGSFVKKRDEHSVLNTKDLKNTIDETIQKAIADAGNRIKAVDKDALLKELQMKLDGYDEEDIQKALKQSESNLNQVMTPEQVKTLRKNQRSK